MYDNYNYPPGADTPDAPWNQRDNKELKFDVEVCVQFVKTMPLHTSDYFTKAETIGDDIEDFYYVNTDHNWKGDYENECYTIPEMLTELKSMIEKELPSATGQRKTRLIGMLRDCQGWEQFDFYAEQV